ncbi:MAG: site-specific integrase [Candidatus Pacearchaeota archaeon]|nr:site-specific integrase [Candidatus Pacearchaeota archaeon]
MPSQPITKYQFKKLLKLTRKEKNKFLARRDILYYKILWKLGFRVSEGRLIKISEINFHDKTIFIPAENNKERNSDYFPITFFLRWQIKRYVKKMPFKSQWLFPRLNQRKQKDSPVSLFQMERVFSERMRELGFLHESSPYKDGKRKKHNLNLYSFRKRFGTAVYRKTHCPKTTASMLRQTDPELKAVWSYVFMAEKEQRRGILNKISF